MPGGGPARPCSTAKLIRSPQERQFLFAHLKLVAARELVGLDPFAVHIRPVQRAEVVDIDAVTPPYQQRVVARDGHVVEKDLRLGTPPDARLVALHEERLPRPSPAR